MACPPSDLCPSSPCGAMRMKEGAGPTFTFSWHETIAFLSYANIIVFLALLLCCFIVQYCTVITSDGGVDGWWA